MGRICATLSLLLSDERSAVRRKVAALFALVVLVTAGAGVLLTALGEDTHRSGVRRILKAAEDLASQPMV